MKFLKISPFLVVLGILEVIFFFGFIYYTFIENNGGMALAGTIFFIAFGINFMILGVEQLILNKLYKYKNWIFFIECCLLFVAIIHVYTNGISIG